MVDGGRPGSRAPGRDASPVGVAPAVTSSAMSLRRLRVFAVEETSAQVCWAALPVGDVVLSAGDVRVTVASDGRPGAVDVNGLVPATRYTLEVDGRSRLHFDTLAPPPREAGARPRLPFDPLAPPPGRLLCRFAPVNDLHIGERDFGAVLRMREGGLPAGAEPYPLRCARAALAEAVAWGAEAIVA